MNDCYFATFREIKRRLFIAINQTNLLWDAA